MQGRKPKPTALKALAGNPGKRAINYAEPRPRVVLPKPPEHLSDDEKSKWKLTVRELYPLGLITTIDKDALAMYCTIYVRWVKAERMVRDKGEIIKTAAGNIIQNPYLSIANRALDQLNKLGAEFGMTPSSRSRVKTESIDPNNELERMLFGQRIKVSNDRRTDLHR
jgi:P27 family predicted phage terminase small subunit